MNIKDVKVGMKVVPFKKTVPDFKGLKNSYCWKLAKEQHPEHPFMYVTQNLDEYREGFEEDMPAHVIALSDVQVKNSGDYFFAGDVKPYEQPTRKARH